jgi:hypothetical protein
MINDKHDVESVTCPKCGGTNHCIYDCDEKQFDMDGTGHVNFDHHCKDCNNNFRSYTTFKYEITEQTAR